MFSGDLKKISLSRGTPGNEQGGSRDIQKSEMSYSDILNHIKRNFFSLPSMRQIVRPELKKVRQWLLNLKLSSAIYPCVTLWTQLFSSMPPCLFYKIRTLIFIVLVMVNFMGLLGWATGAQVLKNIIIIQGVCLRVFLEQINI